MAVFRRGWFVSVIFGLHFYAFFCGAFGLYTAVLVCVLGPWVAEPMLHNEEACLFCLVGVCPDVGSTGSARCLDIGGCAAGMLHPLANSRFIERRRFVQNDLGRGLSPILAHCGDRRLGGVGRGQTGVYADACGARPAD